jgi:hypothetical protein
MEKHMRYENDVQSLGLDTSMSFAGQKACMPCFQSIHCVGDIKIVRAAATQKSSFVRPATLRIMSILQAKFKYALFCALLDEWPQLERRKRQRVGSNCKM